MGSLKLNLAPDQAGYAVADGEEVLSTRLDGGASRYRQDVLNASAQVNVQWRVNPEEFRYLRSFHNLVTGKGAKTFLIDLYLDREELTEHECHFMPGSFRLTGQRGRQFTVSAKLEAKPIKLTTAEDEAERIWITLYGELGPEFETLFPPLEADIDQVITFGLPYDLLGYGPPTINTWYVDLEEGPIFADGTGWNNGFGVSIDGHTVPAVNPSYVTPVTPTLGDYDWNEFEQIPAWFDGVGWVNGMGTPIYGHTPPAPDLGYTRPVSPQLDDMIFDANIQIPLWYGAGVWFNIMQGEE